MGKPFCMIEWVKFILVDSEAFLQNRKKKVMDRIGKVKNCRSKVFVRISES